MANNPLIGTWKATQRQATLGETPIRPLKPGDLADLTVRPDGTAEMVKKKLFGSNRERGTWEYQGDGAYVVTFPEAALELVCLVRHDDVLMARWCSIIGALDGMGVYYRRA